MWFFFFGQKDQEIKRDREALSEKTIKQLQSIDWIAWKIAGNDTEIDIAETGFFMAR